MTTQQRQTTTTSNPLLVNRKTDANHSNLFSSAAAAPLYEDEEYDDYDHDYSTNDSKEQSLRRRQDEMNSLNQHQHFNFSKSSSSNYTFVKNKMTKEERMLEKEHALQRRHSTFDDAAASAPSSSAHLDPKIPLSSNNINNDAAAHPPKWSFHKRVLPSTLTGLSSPEGRSRFTQSLCTGYAESYLPLSEQFLTQSDPAFCGLTTLVMILNALSIDPNVRWKGGWRWYGHEIMLGSGCCLNMEKVAKEGITLNQFAAVGKCHGADVTVKRPGDECNNSLETFRANIIQSVQNPLPSASDDCGFVITSFDRSALGQTGGGHFSPVAAYHPDSDSVLILDVARFKYSPYWVNVSDLYNSMTTTDEATGQTRGWALIKPGWDSPAPETNEDSQRPAGLVRDGLVYNTKSAKQPQHHPYEHHLSTSMLRDEPSSMAASPLAMPAPVSQVSHTASFTTAAAAEQETNVETNNNNASETNKKAKGDENRIKNGMCPVGEIKINYCPYNQT